jgi:TPR repeat protein
LNDEAAHNSLLHAAEHDNNPLAKAFYLRFYIKKNNFNIPQDLSKAKTIAAELLPWLFQQADSIDNKSLMVACCEYIIAYYYCHEIIPCNEGVSHREEAVAWMTRSANHYYAPAISNLGVFYDIGEGVCKDMMKAVELYQRATQMNFAPAICNLATCFLNGHGTTQDLVKAASLFERSYSHGFIPAASNLGYCYDKGHGVPINKVEAVRLYRIAAEKGNQSAQFNLALSYENGEGVEKDLTQAINWYEKSAAQGNKQATTKVIMLQNELIADNCQICLEKANMRGRQILVTPGCCGKLFHEKCFQMFLAKVQNQRLQCPCCREPLPSNCLQHISPAQQS